MVFVKQPQDHRITALETALAQAARRLGLFNCTVLAAVSGGADSLALLLGLKRLGVAVEAACIDHGLRPEAAAEVLHVERIATAFGIPFQSRALTLAHTTGLEAVARDARYAALEALRSARQLGCIATGHTASDQAETVLMRLARGAALGGAAGILERRGDGVVRPLLGVTRSQTVAYIDALGLTPVNDPMNVDRTFTRVRVRHEVLPQLIAATGPGTERALARFASLAFEDDAFLMAEAKNGLARAIVPAPQALGPGLDRIALLSLALPLRRRALALYFELHAIVVDAQLIDDSLESIARAVASPLPKDLLLTVRSGLISVEQAPERTS